LKVFSGGVGLVRFDLNARGTLVGFTDFFQTRGRRKRYVKHSNLKHCVRTDYRATLLQKQELVDGPRAFSATSIASSSQMTLDCGQLGKTKQ